MESLYIIQENGKKHTYKIGRTTHLNERVKTLQTATSDLLTIEFSVMCRDAALLETKIHGILVKHRLDNGEWFKLLPDVLESTKITIKNLAVEINCDIKHKKIKVTTKIPIIKTNKITNQVNDNIKSITPSSVCLQKSTYQSTLELQNSLLTNKIKLLEQELVDQKEILNKESINKIKLLEQKLVDQTEILNKESVNKIKLHESTIKSLQSRLASREVYLDTLIQNNIKQTDFLMQKVTNTDTLYDTLIDNMVYL